MTKSYSGVPLKSLFIFILALSSMAHSSSPKKPPPAGGFSLGGLGFGDGSEMSDEELLGGKIPGLPPNCADPLSGKKAAPTDPNTKTSGGPSGPADTNNSRAGSDAFKKLESSDKFPRPFVNIYKDPSKGIDRVSDLADFVSPDLRSRKFTPVFLSGDEGSGRSAFMNWIASEAQANSMELPASLRKKPIYTLDLSKISGATAVQDIEGIIGRVIKDDAILFIPRGKSMIPDERDNLSEEAIRARRVLLSRIDSGDLRVVIEGDYSIFSKLSKVFTKSRTVEITAPNNEQLRSILMAYKADLEKNFAVTIQQEAIDQLVIMSEQFLKSLGLPGAAVDILESEVERALRNNTPAPGQKIAVGVPEVARGLAKRTGRSVEDMSRSDRDIILSGRKKLAERVFGQSEGIESVVQAVEYARSPLKAPDDMTPYDFILFLGPTGVGKTELARAAAEWLGIPMIERNMEQYIEKHTISEILGSPPGYEGSGDTTTMVHEIKKKIRAVVLLDEFEKAHKDIKQAFLGAPENGRLIGRDRAEALLRETLWIMASNAAEALISRGASKEEIMEELKQHFPAAFLGRCKIVIFNKFGRKELRQIVPMIEKKFVSVLAKSNIKITIDPAVLDGVVEATDVDLGARNLRNTFRNLIGKPLAKPYHQGLWQRGDSLHIFRKGDEVWFRATNPSGATVEEKLSDIQKFFTAEELAAQESPADPTVRAMEGKVPDGAN